MFSYLDPVSTAVAALAVYRALTELFESFGVSKKYKNIKNIRNELMHSKILDIKSEEVNKLTICILKEIEEVNKKKINDLEYDEIRLLAKELSNVINVKASAEPLFNKNVGLAVLKDLRKDYGKLVLIKE